MLLCARKNSEGLKNKLLHTKNVKKYGKNFTKKGYFEYNLIRKIK